MLDKCGEIFLVSLEYRVYIVSAPESQAGQVWWACGAGLSGICFYESLIVKNLLQGKKKSGTALELERSSAEWWITLESESNRTTKEGLSSLF